MNILNFGVTTTMIVLIVGIGTFSMIPNNENIYAQISSEKSSNDTSDSRSSITTAPQESGEISKFTRFRYNNSIARTCGGVYQMM